MSTDFVHSIFHQNDGVLCAHSIKEYLSKRRYNVHFDLHVLQSGNPAVVSNTGVTILLVTPQVYQFIQSRKILDLNAIFPCPEYSVVILSQVEKTRITELLSSRIKHFCKWTVFEYEGELSLSTLGIRVMEIVERLEGWTPVPPLQKFWVWMREGVKSHKQLLLMFNSPVNENSNVKVTQVWDCLKVVAERLNPMTYSYTVGNVEPGERTIEVYVDEISFGKTVLHVESQIQEISSLLHNVVNPVEFFCQCLRIVPYTRENLDRSLRDLLSNNTSSVSHIFDKLNWERFGVKESFYELPTLLHFGAKYGLKLFCEKLLSLPGGTHALNIKNKDGLLPHEIALRERFPHVAPVLQNCKKEPIYLKHLGSPLVNGPIEPGHNIAYLNNTPRNSSRPPACNCKSKSVRSSSDSGISDGANVNDS